MNDITFSMYSGSTLLEASDPRPLAGGASRSFTIMSRMSPRPASPLRAAAPWRTILMPLYSFGLCDAVICAPPSRPSLTTAKYNMSVGAIP
jgi:hypothetical protein